MKKLLEKDRKKLEAKLDKEFSLYIRLLRSDSAGLCTCISCHIVQHYKTMHNAHYIPRACRLYRRDPDNCKPACVSCNTYREGFHYAQYTLYMIKTYGQEKVDQMRLDKNKIHKIPVYRLQEMIDYYKEQNKLLLASKDNDNFTKTPRKKRKEIQATNDA